MAAPGRSPGGVKLRSTGGVLRKSDVEELLDVYTDFHMGVQFYTRLAFFGGSPFFPLLATGTELEGDAILTNEGMLRVMNSAFAGGGGFPMVTRYIDDATFTVADIDDEWDHPTDPPNSNPVTPPAKHPGWSLSGAHPIFISGFDSSGVVDFSSVPMTITYDWFTILAVGSGKVSARAADSRIRGGILMDTSGGSTAKLLALGVGDSGMDWDEDPTPHTNSEWQHKWVFTIHTDPAST